jgi:hypothetical protein
VRNEEVLNRIEEERNILHTIKMLEGGTGGVGRKWNSWLRHCATSQNVAGSTGIFLLT